MSPLCCSNLMKKIVPNHVDPISSCLTTFLTASLHLSYFLSFIVFLSFSILLRRIFSSHSSSLFRPSFLTPWIHCVVEFHRYFWSRWRRPWRLCMRREWSGMLTIHLFNSFEPHWCWSVLPRQKSASLSSEQNRMSFCERCAEAGNDLVA